MNTNEDYISNQIAVYKNSRTLLEFQDKLKVAPIASYAHIHANGEAGADGRRTHSLIGILMKDYSKGTGDKAITVCANISPKEAKFILSRLTAGFSEYASSRTRSSATKMDRAMQRYQRYGSSVPRKTAGAQNASCPGTSKWRTERASPRKMPTAGRT